MMINDTTVPDTLDNIPFADSEEETESKSEPLCESISSITNESCPETPPIQGESADKLGLFYENCLSTASVTSATEEEDFEEVEDLQKCGDVSAISDYDGIVHCKPALVRIPNITITESSDSEEEIDEMPPIRNDFGVKAVSNQAHVYCDTSYARPFPTYLYDIKEVEEPFSDASDLESNSYHDDKRNMHDCKYQEKINALKYEVRDKGAENKELRSKIVDLQRDIMNKSWSMDHLQEELESFQAESDSVRKKLLKVEEDLVKYKSKNLELNEELIKSLERETSCKQLNELENEIKKLKCTIFDLRSELKKVIAEKQELQKRLVELDSQKNERIKTVELALDATLKEKVEMKRKFEADYEHLRTLNSDREQHMVNDFEWKLREVEVNCKRKLGEKEKWTDEKIKQVRKELESEILRLREQIKQIEKYKSYEAEVVQLRGLIQEQDRSLRLSMRTTEQLQSNDRILNEEINKLRNTLEKERAHLSTIQAIHSREIAEKDRKHMFKLDQQQNEINAQCEEKMGKEVSKLKLEIEKQYKDEKRTLLDGARLRTEKLIKENDEIWNKKLRECKSDLSLLEEKLAEKEESYRNELFKLQTNSDSDLLEMRRKFDRLDLSYQEQLEKKEELHERELENLRDEYEQKIQQNEQNCSQQISSTRATLELVKEQLQRDAETQMEALNKKYILQIEQQYDRLIKEKNDVMNDFLEKHNSEMSEINNKMVDTLKERDQKENELVKQIEVLKTELEDSNHTITSLKQTNNELHDKIDKIQGKLSFCDNLRREMETSMKNQQAEQAGAISRMKEFYETEIKFWQEKLVTQQIAESKEVSFSEKDVDNIIVPPQNHSKSARRRAARARQKNQVNRKQHHLLTHQISTSSI